VLLVALNVVVSYLGQLVGSIECLRCIYVNSSQISKNFLLVWMIKPSISLLVDLHWSLLDQRSGCHNLFLRSRHSEGINFEPELVRPVSHDVVTNYGALVVDLMWCLTVSLAKIYHFTVGATRDCERTRLRTKATPSYLIIIYTQVLNDPIISFALMLVCSFPPINHNQLKSLSIFKV